jgi:hypothetical protein
MESFVPELSDLDRFDQGSVRITRLPADSGNSRLVGHSVDSDVPKKPNRLAFRYGVSTGFQRPSRRWLMTSTQRDQEYQSENQISHCLSLPPSLNSIDSRSV